MISSFDFQQFYSLLYEAAKTAFLEVQQVHAGEKFYYFALFTCGDLVYVFPSSGTEEGLTEVAQKYIDKGQNHGLTLQQQRHVLRWSPCDSPLHLEGQEYFEAVNELLLQIPNILDGFPSNSWEEFNAFVDQFMGICVEVMRKLDAEGIFGSGEKRNAIVLNVFMGDQSDDERLKYARLLNPEGISERFQSELADEKMYYQPQNVNNEGLIPIKGKELYNQAVQLYYQGNYPAAKSNYEQALLIYENSAGKDHVETARCLNGLARAQMALGEHKIAQELADRGLKIRMQTFGLNHKDTAESLHTLGEIKHDRGDFKNGEELTDQALKIRELTLGLAHPDTIESMKSLALMLAYAGKRTRAEVLLEQALDICEKEFGELHISTAKVLNGLGVLWAKDQATRLKARKMYERALAINKQIRPNHPDVALLLNNLSALLADMGDLEKAVDLSKNSLELHERIYSPANPHLVFVLINLADIYKKQKNYSEARILYERALIISEKSLGARHPMTMRSLKKLVGILGILSKQGDKHVMEEGMPLYICLTALEAADGPLPPEKQNMPGAHLDPAQAVEKLHLLVAKLETDRNRSPLSEADQESLQQAQQFRQQAEVFYDKGEYITARTRLEDALTIQKNILGEYHLEHIDPLKKLARVYEKLGYPSKFLPILQHVVNIYTQVLGLDHPTTLLALSDLQSRYYYEYGLTKSLPLSEEIIKGQEGSLGPQDRFVKMMKESFTRLQTFAEKQKGSESEPLRSRSEKREEALKTIPLERAALLDGIDKISWHDLHHAYGPADDVPNLMRLLLSDEQSVQDDAWETLYSNIWHQGDIYEASAYVVPFLIKLLNYDGPPGKAHILQFLDALANGRSGLDSLLQTETDKAKWRDVMAKQGRDLDTELQKSRDALEMTNSAVSEGIPLYFDIILNNSDPNIRKLSLGVLASLRGWSEQIVPVLLGMLPSLSDPDTRSTAVNTLHALMDSNNNSRQFFTELIKGNESDRTKFIAAIALAHRAQGQTPDGAVNIIQDALRERSKIPRKEFFSISNSSIWEWGDLQTGIEALLKLGPERAFDPLLYVLSIIQDGEETLSVADVLLNLVFGEGKIVFRSPAWIGQGKDKRPRLSYDSYARKYPRNQPINLTENQLKVLTTITDRDLFWYYEHDLLKMYGLPISRQELKEFISGFTK